MTPFWSENQLLFLALGKGNGIHKECTCFLLPFLLGMYLSMYLSPKKKECSVQNRGGGGEISPPLHQSLPMHYDHH